MKKHRIRTGRIGGELTVPGSRSITNRALIAAALASGTSTLRRSLEADDTVAMRQALRALGVSIADHDPTVWVIGGSGGELSAPPGVIDVGASGTSARFITAVASLVHDPVEIDGTARMRLRPIADLVDALRTLGSDVTMLGDGPGPPLRVAGPRPAGRRLRMDASRSSQYVSAIALIAPLLEGDTIIDFKDGLLVSQPYVEMTIDVINAFGGAAELKPGPSLFVQGSTGYRATDFVVESDMSSAVYPAAAAALSGGTIEIHGVAERSRQADRVFFDILEDMGCSVVWTETGVIVGGPGRLSAVERDMNAAPDAALMLAVMGGFADGVSTVSNVGNLRIKESDRLTALNQALAGIGIASSITSDSITVTGGAPRSGTIETYSDHRIAMSFGVAGVVVPGIDILDPDCVSKTWPEFFAALDEITISPANVPVHMHLIIALDGPGGSGKTTVSRAVGEQLGLPHLDTGAFYRAATLVTVEAGIDPYDAPAVIAEVARHEYGYVDGAMLVDGRDVSVAIRADTVTRAASPVSAIPKVRTLMVDLQRDWVATHGGSAVVEGRDIGTVVFPGAELKVFLTASQEIRAARRASEQGNDDISRVAGELERRDSLDSTRKDSPLLAADDALVLDTSDLTITEVVDRIVTTARERRAGRTTSASD